MAKDIFHDAVKSALEKDGWLITHDPYAFELGEVSFRIDLGAERVIAAEKNDEKIAVEIKTFLAQSDTDSFHKAIGQYFNYLVALEEREPNRELYLAVPKTTFDDFFQRPFVQKALKRMNTKVIVYEPFNEIIEKWIKL
jgi:XisH protein